MARSGLEDTYCNPNKLSMTPKFLMLKLSHGLVLTGYWALPNCNVVSNCAGSPWHFLRQNLQDGKCIFIHWKLARGLICNFPLNGWHITRGTQPKRKMLRLESRCYNESHPGRMLMASLRVMIEGLFYVASNPCWTFLSSACMSFTPNQVYPLVRIYHRAIWWRFHKRLSFALLELMYRWFWASTLHGVGSPSSHVILISHMTSGTILFELSK
jgi:hypothetical protein